MSPKKLAFSAVFVCFAAALSALETMLPPIVPITGVRVGLGNVVTLFLLHIGGSWKPANALAVTILRCLVAALIVGSPLSAIYGLSGGVLAWAVMSASRALFSRVDKTFHGVKFLPFTAVFGAIFHIFGQMFVAVAFYGTMSILAYLPILMASAVLGGLFTGFLTYLILKKLPERLLEKIRRV